MKKAFFGSLRSSSFRAASVVVDGDRSAINWVFDYTTGDGQRYRMDEIASQTWQDGKIVRERFVYDTATLQAAASEPAGTAQGSSEVSETVSSTSRSQRPPTVRK